MAKLTVEQINDLSRKVDTIFHVTYEELSKNQDIWFGQLKYDRRTNRKEIDFVWLQDRFGPKEGKRKQAPQYRTLEGNTYRVPLRKWEDAVEVDTFDVYEDDEDLVLRQAMAIAQNASRHEQDLMVEKLRLGNTSAVKTWDLENLFSTTHPKGGTTFSNLLSLGALSKTTFQAARTAMQRFPSDEGSLNPLGILGNKLVVPPDVEYTAKELMQNTYVKGGSGEAENVLQGMADVLIDARLTDVDDWYLLASDGVVKPFVTIRHKVEGDPVLNAETDVNSEAFKNHEAFRWWYRYFMEVAPTKPEYLIKVLAP